MEPVRPAGGVAPRPAPGWVLVVDDTESIRRLIRINLELAGFLVADRTDGQAALELLMASTDNLPAVVVIDAQMEPRDGWWAVARIRATPALAHLPVVMVTAAMQDYDRKRAGAAGLDAFVGKPFDPDHLVEIVEGFAAFGRAFETADRP